MLANKFIVNCKYFNKWKVLLVSSSQFPVTCVTCKNSSIAYKAPNYVLSSSIRTISTSSVFHKYNKHSSKDDDSDSDDDHNDPAFKDERDSKVVKVKVNSLRADLILKTGLLIARNKIEVIFYESKIRVNGQKISKKSAHLNVGDEIDVIKGFSTSNSSHLVIARVQIISAKEKDEAISVHLRRYRTMLVENYSGINAFKSSEASSLEK